MFNVVKTKKNILPIIGYTDVRRKHCVSGIYSKVAVFGASGCGKTRGYATKYFNHIIEQNESAFILEEHLTYEFAIKKLIKNNKLCGYNVHIFTSLDDISDALIEEMYYKRTIVCVSLSRMCLEKTEAIRQTKLLARLFARLESSGANELGSQKVSFFLENITTGLPAIPNFKHICRTHNVIFSAFSMYSFASQYIDSWKSILEAMSLVLFHAAIEMSSCVVLSRYFNLSEKGFSSTEILIMSASKLLAIECNGQNVVNFAALYQGL